MKIFRAPQKGGYWSHTDTKEPSEYVENWTPGKRIVLDATIDKSGERHSAIGLELYEEDVLSLFNSVLSNYKKRIIELDGVVKYFENEINKKQEENIRLTEAFLKLYRLTSLHKDKAPDDNTLIETVHKIADFYYFKIDDMMDNNPEIEWIDWNSI